VEGKSMWVFSWDAPTEGDDSSLVYNVIIKKVNEPIFDTGTNPIATPFIELPGDIIKITENYNITIIPQNNSGKGPETTTNIPLETMIPGGTLVNVGGSIEQHVQALPYPRYIDHPDAFQIKILAPSFPMFPEGYQTLDWDIYSSDSQNKYKGMVKMPPTLFLQEFSNYKTVTILFDVNPDYKGPWPAEAEKVLFNFNFCHYDLCKNFNALWIVPKKPLPNQVTNTRVGFKGF